MATPGGPLLSVADMLKDLSEDSTFRSNLPSSPIAPFVNPSATQKPRSGFEKEVLRKSFEETYNQLNVALKQSGHSWTGLTQELCATLTTADKLVATAHTSLGQLTEEVKRLEEIVERGHDAFLQLQGSVGQNTNVPLPRR